MRLTTKGRFAVTAMIDLAMNAQTGAVKLSAISERQSISLSYLEQLFSKLRRARETRRVISRSKTKLLQVIFALRIL